MTATPSLPLPETYRDCLAFFYARNQFAMKLGLENIHALLDRLGNPERGLTFLHVAGTNGKGSVCANLAALAGAAGYRRVGLYTSPHLVSFRERIQVDGEPIPAAFIVAWLRRALPVILELQATYFECVTALALDYFRDRACGAVVLETGLGGRLDATNAVMPAITVITSISLDHTSILGDTVEAIWKEKIGILKPGIPMVVREDRPALLEELERRAAAFGSPVIRLMDHAWEEIPGAESPAAIRFHGRYATYELPGDLRPESHQRENLALSLLAMEVFLGRALPPPETWIPALRQARMPGRTQWLEAPGLPPVLLDGAHNPGGIDALAAYLARAFPGRRVQSLFAVMKDKDYAAVCRRVLGFSERILFVPLGDEFPRALAFAELEAALSPAERARVEAFPLAPGALEAWLRSTGPLAPRVPAPDPRAPFLGAPRPGTPRPGGDDLVVACGSLYLLGKLIPQLTPLYPGLNWFRQFTDEFDC
ncbi:MAG: bifunctional folylpolyglutamate synthase/dihydrofolate synthase [Fibrobacteres bacterium]|nr:bifunctional folylpolyglutamate synthase/dihydrofolate synthase [Fibrobacterota bacterium]